MIHFTRHFTRLAAEKHYGDLSRRYRGNAQSDFELTIYDDPEKFAFDLGGDYVIDWKARTARLKGDA